MKRTSDNGGDSKKTTDTKKRFAATNDILAVLLVGSMVALVGWHTYIEAEIPLWLAMAFVLSTVTAIVWAFGGGAFEKAADVVTER